MNVWLVSPAWRRYEVTRVALAERRWLCDQLAARGLTADSVIVADDDNLDIAREYGFHTVEMGNDDLSGKFNAGYRYAADQGADVFCHIGSDDWVHPDAFSILVDLDLSTTPPPVEFTPDCVVVWRKAARCVAQRNLTIVDLTTGQAQRCSVRGRYGCIPWLIPRAALEPHGFRPIKPGLGRGIDGALVRGMTTRPNWIFQDVADDVCVDFKGTVNLTPFRGLAHTLGEGAPVDAWPALAKKYPATLVEMARALSADVAAATRKIAEQLRPIDEACAARGIDFIVEYAQ